MIHYGGSGSVLALSHLCFGSCQSNLSHGSFSIGEASEKGGGGSQLQASPGPEEK